MTRPMLPEEKALRAAVKFNTVRHYGDNITRLIPALIRAVDALATAKERERCVNECVLSGYHDAANMLREEE